MCRQGEVLYARSFTLRSSLKISMSVGKSAETRRFAPKSAVRVVQGRHRCISFATYVFKSIPCVSGNT